MTLSCLWGSSDDLSRRDAARELYHAVSEISGLPAWYKTLGQATIDSFKDLPDAARKEGQAYVDEMLLRVMAEYEDHFVASYSAEFSAEEMSQLALVIRLSRSPLMERLTAHERKFQTETRQLLDELKDKVTKDLRERMTQKRIKQGKDKG